MNAVIVTTPDELRAIVADEVGKVIERLHRSTPERIGIDGMAARYSVNRRTICYWLKQPGKLPPRRAGEHWLLSDVAEWERQVEIPKKAQRST
jgi:hypothetical protein